MIPNNYQVSSKFNASKSLMMITDTTNNRCDQIFLRSHREEQYAVISSKLPNKKLFTRKCVYILNDLYDCRNAYHIARDAFESWIVWNFHSDICPKFDNDLLMLGKKFPVFRNVYRVMLKKKIHITFSSVIVFFMSVVVFHAVIFFESQTKLKITWSKFSIGKSMLLTLVMIPNLVVKSWMHVHCNSVMREMVFPLRIHCCQDV